MIRRYGSAGWLQKDFSIAVEALRADIFVT